MVNRTTDNAAHRPSGDASMKRGFWRMTAVSWALAVIVPLISAAGAYLWADLTTTVLVCATGSGGTDVSIVVFFLLTLAAPVAVGWHVRRAGRPILGALLPIFVSATFGFVSVYLGFQFWWGAHNCMT